jgi:hypothetical protein
MKKLLIAGLIIVGASLISCNGNNGSTKSQLSSQSSDNQLSQNQDSSKDYSKLGFELSKKESIGELKLGIKIKDVEVIIGLPTEKSEPTLWQADGAIHQTVKYSEKGIELDLIQNPDSSFLVNMVTVSSPCKFKTSSGIGIESTKNDVIKAYSNYIDPKSSDDKEIVAGSIYGGIIFKLEDLKVKSIFIGAAAE